MPHNQLSLNLRIKNQESNPLLLHLQPLREQWLVEELSNLNQKLKLNRMSLASHIPPLGSLGLDLIIWDRTVYLPDDLRNEDIEKEITILLEELFDNHDVKEALVQYDDIQSPLESQHLLVVNSLQCALEKNNDDQRFATSFLITCRRSNRLTQEEFEKGYV